MPPPKSPTSATPSETVRTSRSMSSVGSLPLGRTRAGSRSMKIPPLPRPPPTIPLPAVPTSSSIPPVPPLPPHFKKQSMKMPSQLPISSPTRSTFAGAPPSTSMAVATPASPPGNLRPTFTTELDWYRPCSPPPASSLPSPPASPTRSSKSRLTPPSSPSKGAKKQASDHKRPMSIGVLEAADNAQVRRTKSILLLGSRSKSNASLGTPSASPPKRVQIHADAIADADSPPRKPRCKSSLTLGAAFGSGSVLSGDSEILVLRERRHSAPLLSRAAPRSDAATDWTLSLPFCTDVPGNQIMPAPASPSSLPQAQEELELGADEPQGDDWTLCMPLKAPLAETATFESVEEGEESVSECTAAQPPETCMSETQMQLPTPSPSPTPSTPLARSRALDADEPRPASPACLGPHAGGLDMDGGCGKRGSGWDTCGWFESVEVPARPVETKVTMSYGRSHEAWARNRSQDSTATISTGFTGFYSARSSLLAA
ncbi:hypothetical protein BU15DRAFT_77697 [Melanogaster broomeanus]|nr:hypothetical protein BU15DRAFT_77697 [Melanogaster broomeanus]